MLFAILYSIFLVELLWFVSFAQKLENSKTNPVTVTITLEIRMTDYCGNITGKKNW